MTDYKFYILYTRRFDIISVVENNFEVRFERLRRLPIDILFVA